MTDKPAALAKQFQGMPLARKKKQEEDKSDFSEYDKVSLGHANDEAKEGGEKSEAGDGSPDKKVDPIEETKDEAVKSPIAKEETKDEAVAKVDADCEDRSSEYKLYTLFDL